MPSTSTTQAATEEKTLGDPAQTRIAFIHLLRGIAPLLVLWAHLGGWWLSANQKASPLMDVWTLCVSRPLHLYQDGGHLGVLIFFLVSGFVITHVSRRESPLEFGVRRALRLLPPFWVTVGIVVILVALSRSLNLPGVLAVQSSDYVTSLLFLNWVKGSPAVLTVAWTLFIEIIFYVLTGLLINLTRRQPIVGTWIIIAVPLIGNILMMSFPGLIPVMFALMYLPFLSIGRAGYLWWSGISPALKAMSAACGGYLTFVLVFGNVNPGILLRPGSEAVVSHAIALLAFFGLCASGMQTVPRPVSFCADISYSLYLLHAPVGSVLLGLLCGAGLRYEIAILLVVPAVLFVAWVSYISVERPAQRLARRLSSRA